MTLRGFDSYEVTLGDEMRGERASMGKSLADVEADLCIKQHLIAAIENCDLEAFTNQGLIAGYVRSYSRYLGLDVDTTYSRFCDEAGFVAAVQTDPFRTKSGASNSARSVPCRSDVAFTQSRFAVPPTPVHRAPTIAIGAIVSTLSLIGLVGGLGYGGFMLLEEVQRVGFEPVPVSPVVVSDAPVLAAAEPVDVAEPARPAATDYVADGSLSGLFAHPANAASLPQRDGPISAINPATSGLFTDAPRIPAVARPTLHAAVERPEFAIPHETFTEERPLREIEPAVVALSSGPPRIVLHAVEEAWIRVRSDEGSIVFEGILGAGDRFDLPERLDSPTLRAGNAGGVYVIVGEQAYGPLGGRGQVARAVALTPDSVQSAYPSVDAATLRSAQPEPEGYRAAID